MTDSDILTLARVELTRARALHPAPNPNVLAWIEEVGELAEAIVEHGPQSERAREEAAQVIAMTVRVIEEGDDVTVEDAALLGHLVGASGLARVLIESEKI